MSYICKDFDKKHLRNCIRTLKRYLIVEIKEYYNNSLGMSHESTWKGKLKSYKIESFPENAFCKLSIEIGKHSLEFDIPYNSEVYYGDITKGQNYIIDYINSGPHCQYVFKKII